MSAGRQRIKIRIGRVPVILAYTLAYTYSGAASMYFILMVPTGDIRLYTYHMAQWFYGVAVWLAPMFAIALWLLFTAFIAVLVIWVLKS